MDHLFCNFDGAILEFVFINGNILKNVLYVVKHLI